jgi:hypothetical protein
MPKACRQRPCRQAGLFYRRYAHAALVTEFGSGKFIAPFRVAQNDQWNQNEKAVFAVEQPPTECV